MEKWKHRVGEGSMDLEERQCSKREQNVWNRSNEEAEMGMYDGIVVVL